LLSLTLLFFLGIVIPSRVLATLRKWTRAAGAPHDEPSRRPR
jgi:hypothetical protein